MGNLQEKVSSLHLQDRVSSLHGRTKGLGSEFGDKKPRVLLLGLDGAGKTSLLYKAKLNSTMFANVPPIGANIEEMTPRRGATIAVWDMRGDKLHRHLWRNYYMKTEAIVFVVDSSDKVRLDEAQYELAQLRQSSYLSKVPVVVAANKQDAEGALGPDEVAGLLELGEIQDRHWAIFGTNSQKGKGIKDVFKEVVRLIKLTRKEKIERKSELLKKHNDKLKESKDTEIEEKVPPLDVDLSDDSIKKHSLFDSINKSNPSSEDGNENRSEKSDQYDTVFDGSTNIVKPDEVETVSYDNKDEYENVDQDLDKTEEGNKVVNERASVNMVKGMSNRARDSDEGLKTSETNVADVNLNNDSDTTAKTDSDRNSVTDVKVTDLDSDSDESTQDTIAENQLKRTDEASLRY